VLSNKSAKQLKVVLFWHMHQPEYRDAINDQYQLPWTYLHAIKDYVDMVAILEQQPAGRAVINFVPILLEQIDDYAQQTRAFLDTRQPVNDPLLAALVANQFPDDFQHRLQLIKSSLRANEVRLINRFEPYRRLADMMAFIDANPKLLMYLGDDFLADILTWYHLAWLGETVRRDDGRVIHLLEKGQKFTHADRLSLFEIITELLEGVLPRYRALSEKGQVELSMTPYAHPMIPLLLDFNSAREALPGSPLPVHASYPGGEERAHWHVQQGLKSFEHFFGQRPRGCWPAEGGVSDGLIDVLSDYSIDWIVTGESTLRNSLARSEQHCHEPMEEHLHRGYRIAEHGPVCFFRDDGLSDLIGFSYSNWHGDDAVNNLVHHLETIAEECGGDNNRVVSIVLDGENAWESYPENGYHFLSALYERLGEHENLDLTTFSRCLDNGLQPGELASIVAGSWVYGTFSTWMGDADKNRGWDLLCEAKQAFDKTMVSGKLTAEQIQLAQRQLAICEGSDWFWWFGDYNPSATVKDFEQLYRRHLLALYNLIEVEPPTHLQDVISQGGGDPAQGGVMRPGQATGN
jgi:alpha-amylase/alpha-mannosidase (GH57 family)